MAVYSRAQEKRKLRKDLERDAKTRDRAKLAGLRNLVTKAKGHKKKRMSKVVKACKQARTRDKKSSKGVRARHRAAAQTEIDLQQLKSRKLCGVNKERAKAKGASGTARAKGQLDTERREQRIRRIYAQPATALGSSRQTTPKVKKETKAQVTEAEVLADIPQELVPVWHKVKGRIKGTDWKTRTEAFLEWVQENQSEVFTIMEADTERYIRDLERQEQEMRAQMAPSVYRKLTETQLRRRTRAAAPAPVPF